jgi:hypothetical protein
MAVTVVVVVVVESICGATTDVGTVVEVVANGTGAAGRCAVRSAREVPTAAATVGYADHTRPTPNATRNANRAGLTCIGRRYREAVNSRRTPGDESSTMCAAHIGAQADAANCGEGLDGSVAAHVVAARVRTGHYAGLAPLAGGRIVSRRPGTR